MTLTASQAAALRNLARKQAGHEVDWINISDARVLTELGMAERSREGWKITPAGEEILNGMAEDAPEAEANAPLPFTGRS